MIEHDLNIEDVKTAKAKFSVLIEKTLKELKKSAAATPLKELKKAAEVSLNKLIKNAKTEALRKAAESCLQNLKICKRNVFGNVGKSCCDFIREIKESE